MTSNQVMTGEESFSLVVDLAAIRAAPGYWYLATPFTRYRLGGRDAFENSAALSSILTASGICNYSPIVAHCYAPTLAPSLDLYDQVFWMRATAPLRRRAHGIIVGELAGWQASDGVTTEIEEFLAAGKPVYHLNRVAVRELLRRLT